VPLPEQIRRLLAGPLPGTDAQRRMAPRWQVGAEPMLVRERLRPAAGLILLYPHGDEWHVPLTQRGTGLRQHRGQISLPGGRMDPGESAVQTALREAHEEVGVVPDQVEILGQLTPLPISVSEFLLHPVVGVAPARPDFRVAAGEVEQLIELPLSQLRRPDLVKWEVRRRTRPPEVMMDVPYFDVPDHRVWGATAMVLAEFVALLAMADELDRR
jgi:8-oxo-dGTP pyrophosphatase MutT (NUDIX family)